MERPHAFPDSREATTAPLVCGVDGSAASLAAARLARRLAQASGRAVRYVHVALADRVGRGARAVQERLAEAVGPDAELHTITGWPAQELARSASAGSMLVLGTRARGPLRRAVRGGVATAVARAAAAPVVVVPAHAAVRPAALVCGVRDERDLPCAASSACLARELDLRLTLVHVVPPPRLPLAAAGGAPPPSLVPSAEEEWAIAAGMLDDVAGAIAASAPASWRTLVVEGGVGDGLAGVAASEGAALVALGPSRHRAVGRALGRRSARAVLRRARCPVIACPSLDAILAANAERRPRTPPARRTG